MDFDPFVSAVVEVSSGAAGSEGERPVEDPSSVPMEAAAVLGGVDLEVVGERGSYARPKPSAEDDAGAIAKVKGYFTRAGFEVHAPVRMSFSIAAHQSAFEEFFGQQLAVDEETLGRPVTTADGSRDLPLDKLPADLRHIVKRVYFIPPPDIPLGV